MSKFAFILWPDELAAQVVVVVILVLTVYAVQQCYAADRVLRQGFAALQRFVELRREQASADLAQVTRLLEDEYPVSLFTSRLVRMTDSPLGQRIPREEWDARDQELLEANIHWTRFVASASVFIGLIGTILGLGLAISTITVGGGNMVQLEQQLTRALAGMGTGFSCTFWGVLSSIGLGWASGLYQRRSSQYLRQVEQLLTSDKLFASPEGRTAADSAITFSRAVDRLDTVIKPFAQSLREGSTAISAASVHFTESVPALESFRLSLHQLVISFSEYLPDLARAEGASQLRVQLLADRMMELGNQLERCIPLLGTGGDRLGYVAEALGSQFAHFNSQIDRFVDGQIEFQSSAMGQLQSTAELINKALNEHPAEQGLVQASQQLATLSLRLEQNVNGVVEGSERITGSIRQLGSRFETFATQMEPPLTTGQKALAQQTEELRDTLAAMRTLVSLVEDAIRDAPAVRQNVHEFARDGRSAVDGVQQAAGSLQRAEQHLAQITGSLTRQVEALERQSRYPRRENSGPNVVIPPKPAPWHQRLRDRFRRH